MIRASAGVALPIEVRPIDLDALPLREPVVKEQFLMPAPVLMHEPRDLYVEAAILRDLEQRPSRHQRIASSPAAVF